jgi:Zn-finger nucleic acid-binding protein
VAEPRSVASSEGLAPRLPCPVCLGLQMEKARIDGASHGTLVLDHCPRCGGIWFERGEVARLAAHHPDALWSRISRREEAFRPPCHECHAPMDRSAECCPACGWDNRLLCPECQRPMERRVREGLTLDVCTRCRGVWFDHAELSALWSASLSEALERRATSGKALAVGGDVLMDALIWTPDLVVYGAYAAGHVASAAAQGLAHAPGAVVGAAEVVGDAASGLFESIVEIISSIFEGLG